MTDSFNCVYITEGLVPLGDGRPQHIPDLFISKSCVFRSKRKGGLSRRGFVSLNHIQVLMCAGLAGRPPCLPHSQVLMGAGLAG